MADILSPVKEECVRHGHELDEPNVEGEAEEEPTEWNPGWFDTGLSLLWWSTAPVRYGANKIANVHPPIGNLVLSPANSVVDILQSNFPAMTDENSQKTVTIVKENAQRNLRHKLRSAIRSNPGRSLLQGLDKMIAMSESALVYAESEKKNEATDEAEKESAEETAKEEKGSASPENKKISEENIPERTPATSSGEKSLSTTEKGEEQCSVKQFFIISPIQMWVKGLKRVRRYLYRVGRLRRCKSTRTPAKEIANRPKVSPRKRNVGGSFTSMIRFALSPISGKPGKSNNDDLKGVKGKGFGGPLKRKYDKVTPYSFGDDSDSDTGRILDDYFKLDDYDSEEDSDYVWDSSDEEYQTSDSEEYKTDSEEDELKQEAKVVQSDAGKAINELSAKRTPKPKAKSTPKDAKDTLHGSTKDTSFKPIEKLISPKKNPISPKAVSPKVQVDANVPANSPSKEVSDSLF